MLFGFFFFSFSLKAKISFLLKLYLVLQPKGGSGTPRTLLWLFHWSVTVNNSLIIIGRNTPNLLLDVQNTHHKLIHTPNYKVPWVWHAVIPPLKILSYAPDLLLMLYFWQVLKLSDQLISSLLARLAYIVTEKTGSLSLSLSAVPTIEWKLHSQGDPIYMCTQLNTH